MSSEGSITRWVTALKSGDVAAAQPVWERYHRQLITLARQKLRSSPRRSADEEDVVQSAFNSFFQGVTQQRFPLLNDRDNLWRLLVVITARKALDQLAYEGRKRRGGVGVLPETRITNRESKWDDPAVEEIVGDEPTPEFAAQVAEEYERLLSLLGDDAQRQIAILKMEGFTNAEVAERLHCSARTVDRKLELIRMTWNHESSL